MSSWNVILVLLTFMVSGCSSVSTRVDYHASKADDVQPVCTIWNSENGAALTNAFESQILVKTPAHHRWNLWGPFLVPFIPANLDEISLNPRLELQIIPTEGTTFLLPLQEIEMLFDGKKVVFSSASYRFKGQANSEVTFGSLEEEKLHSSIEVKQPYAIILEASKTRSPPKKIEVRFVIQSGGEKQQKILSFKKESDVDYNPFFFPGMEMDAVCKTKFSDGKTGRDLL